MSELCLNVAGNNCFSIIIYLYTNCLKVHGKTVIRWESVQYSCLQIALIKSVYVCNCICCRTNERDRTNMNTHKLFLFVFFTQTHTRTHTHEKKMHMQKEARKYTKCSIEGHTDSWVRAQRRQKRREKFMHWRSYIGSTFTLVCARLRKM